MKPTIVSPDLICNLQISELKLSIIIYVIKTFLFVTNKSDDIVALCILQSVNEYCIVYNKSVICIASYIYLYLLSN